MKSQFQGNVLAAFSFVLWGLLPLYYQYLPNSDINELLAYRIVFSLPFMLVVFAIMGQKFNIKAVLADKRSLLLTFVAGLLMCVSWYAFTWAITHGDVLAASLGYFINPLFAIAFGVLFLKDKLSHAQSFAVVLGFAGIAYQVYAYGELPWLALIMGSFFAVYGLIKKFIRYDSLTSVTVEALWFMPLAIVYIIWLSVTQQSEAINGGVVSMALFIGSAPVTLAPLIFFALAINRTSLSNIGLMQYIEPSLQFSIAVLMFGEVFDEVKLVSFSLIWLGLIFCTLEAVPWFKNRKVSHSSALK